MSLAGDVDMRKSLLSGQGLAVLKRARRHPSELQRSSRSWWRTTSLIELTELADPDTRDLLRTVWLDPTSLGLMRTIKRSLDPGNLLNPGKIFDC